MHTNHFVRGQGGPFPMPLTIKGTQDAAGENDYTYDAADFTVSKDGGVSAPFTNDVEWNANRRTWLATFENAEVEAGEITVTFKDVAGDEVGDNTWVIITRPDTSIPIRNKVHSGIPVVLLDVNGNPLVVADMSEITREVVKDGAGAVESFGAFSPTGKPGRYWWVPDASDMDAMASWFIATHASSPRGFDMVIATRPA